MIIMGYGASAYLLQRAKVVWPDRAMVYTATLRSYPIERNKSYRLDMELVDRLYGGRSIILYVPKDSAVCQLVPGTEILFYGKINPPSNDNIEEGFDYATYLYRHNISGTLWVNSDRYRILSTTLVTHPLENIALTCRRRLVNKLEEWGLKGETLSIVSALTLGYRDALTDDLRELYSTAGASHILALSGLHIGIIFIFLNFLFPRRMNRPSIRWLKEILIIAIMWIYTYIVGAPYSITRALIMFTMLAICRSFERENSSVNALSVAALVIVVLDPFSVYEVGFQLSFSAVLFILLLQPIIVSWVQPKNTILRYIWEIVSVSLAAQIGTLPLSLYYFSHFSTYFLLTNILVIPLMFVVLILALMLFATSFITPIRQLVVYLLTKLVGLINGGLQYIVELPYSNVNIGENIRPYQILFIYTIILSLYNILTTKSYRCVLSLLFWGCVWSVFEMVLVL